MNNRITRSPKQLGDFGEGLATYALIRKGFDVAYVDHVGADLIAEKEGIRIAVSVKTRLFRPNSKESRMMLISPSHLGKLEAFSEKFGMEAVFTQIVCLADDKKIHMFMVKSSEIPNFIPKTKTGFSIRFGQNNIHKLIDNPLIDYCSWSDENIGSYDFDGK